LIKTKACIKYISKLKIDITEEALTAEEYRNLGEKILKSLLLFALTPLLFLTS